MRQRAATRWLMVAGMVALGAAAAGAAPVRGVVVRGEQATALERYAVRELQRYLYQLHGQLLPEVEAGADLGDAEVVFAVGRLPGHAVLERLRAAGQLEVADRDPGPQGYVLKTCRLDDADVVAVVGGDDEGVLYGVYGLLDNVYDVGFYFSGDVLPPEQRPLSAPQVDLRVTPTMYIRGFLPWTNFPQSAGSYRWEDWTYIIDQMAKMRMNFILVHNYNFGQPNHGHNEMFHNFAYRGYLSRVWMPTARTGHMWRGTKWDVNDYLFGAAGLFDDYDFGSDCGLHNEALDDATVFAKGVSLFQRVIAYAHRRGVKIALGLDIDLIPDEYRPLGATPEDPEVVAARVAQISGDYPDLDYLVCFHSESPQDKEGYWQGIFHQFYEGMKAGSPRTRIAVAGWGLKPELVADLPEDVICAPISPYSDGCESGAIYGEREYWGCPWLERDFNSSEYYYPYTMHLSNTIKAYRTRAANMRGFYCLSWRLTDAVDAKMSYIAKAPWDVADKYTGSTAVYGEYARRNYGPAAAERVTPIIDENEPFASDFGECQPTPPLTPIRRWGHQFNIAWFRLLGGGDQPPQIGATDYSAERGTNAFDTTEGGRGLGWLEPFDWARYEVECGPGVTDFEARVASAADGGVIEIRRNGPDGELLGECLVPATGGWQHWQTVRTTIQPLAGAQTLTLVFMPRPMPREESDLDKAAAQIDIVDDALARAAHPQWRERLAWLRARLVGVKTHLEFLYDLPTMAWNDLPGSFEAWAQSFTRRVCDISSLGNVVSSQNRFVQLRYLGREMDLRAEQTVRSPSWVKAQGTPTGAVVTWRNEQFNAQGFHVFRDGKRLTERPLPMDCRSYEDEADGTHAYRVRVVTEETGNSPPSVAAGCAAGKADVTAPQAVVISPPTSVLPGAGADIVVRLLDNRAAEYLSATLHARTLGAAVELTLPMTRRVKGVFAGQIPAATLGAVGAAYWVRVSDGDNEAFWPAAGPDQPATVVVDPVQDRRAPSMPAQVWEMPGGLAWSGVGGEVAWYRIYRGRSADFACDAASLLTYVAGGTTAYRDNGEDLAGRPLNGAWFYRVTALDELGNESEPSPVVQTRWQGGRPQGDDEGF